MQLELALWIFTLPRFDEKERDRACSVSGKACDAPVEARVAALAPVRVSSVRPQGANAFDDGRKSAQYLADIVRDNGIKVRAVEGRARAVCGLRRRAP